MNTQATAAASGKRRGFRDWTMLAFLLPMLAMISVTRAQTPITNIIYQDNFARTGALDGSTPDTVNVPGAKWFACNVPGLNAQIQTDGSSIALTNTLGTTNFYLNGFLPFVPTVGHIYYLSCNIKPVSGGTNWLALGFATHAVTNSFFNTYQVGAGWLGIRGSGTNISPWGSIGGNSSFTNAIGNNFQTFTVVVDATFGNGAGGLPAGNSQQGWQIRFYTNNVLVPGGNQTIAWGNYPIKYVGIGANGAQGVFQNFTLTDVLVKQGAPTIVEEPQNATGQVGQTASFWVGVTNDYPVAAYQWMTNGTPIPGATNGSYTTPTLDMSYNGLNYSVVITNLFGSTNSSSGALTVVSGRPTVYSVTKTTSLTNLVVAFSKAVDPGTALNPANYTLSPSVSVISASYGSTSNSVMLGTSALNTNTGYSLKVQNVQDLFGNAMIASTNVVLPAGLVFFVRADSGVVYDGSGTLVSQWLDQTTNANNLSQFFGVPSAGPNYLGSLVRPTTNIINNGQLALDFGNTSLPAAPRWMAAPSTPSLESLTRNITMYAVTKFAGTSDEIINKVWGNLPAPFDWDPNPNENVQYGNGNNNAPANGISGTIALNTPYVLATSLSFPPENGLATNNFNFWQNGANNGNGSIRPLGGVSPLTNWDAGFPLWVGARWDLVNPRMRGQIAEIMVFNTALSAADRINVDNYLGFKYFTFAITTDLPAATTSTNGYTVSYTFAAGAGSAHGFSLQWLENGTNIVGATNLTYTTPILAPGDNGDKFVVQVTLPDGSFVYSTTNTLTVVVQGPLVTLAGIPIWNTNQIIVTFDHAVSPATAAVAGNYSLNNGASVLSAAMGDASNKVVLTTSPLSFNANPGFYSLTVQNVQDAFGNTIITSSTAVGLYPNAALWLRADTGVTTDAGTNTVNMWSDLSGNNNTFFGGGGPTIQPALVTNTWNDPVVRFNTTDTVTNYMTTAANPTTLGITGDMSIIAVVNTRALTGRTGHIVSKTGPSNKNIAGPYDFYLGTAGALWNRGAGNGTVQGINYGVYTATRGPSVGYPYVVAASETGNLVSQYLNGQPAGSDVLSAGFVESNDFDQGQVVYIGARSDGFNRLAGDLSELIVAASPMSSSEMASLGNYLSAQHHFVLFNTSQTNLVVSSSNNHVTLSWPSDHTGWQLQSNSVGITATGSWYPVAGSTSTNQLVITPDASKTSVFYRMVFQQP